MPRGYSPKTWVSWRVHSTFGCIVLQHAAESLGHTECRLLEFRSFLRLQRRNSDRWRNCVANVISDLPWSVCQNPESLGEIYGFRHTMGHTKYRGLDAIPQINQQFLHLQPRRL